MSEHDPDFFEVETLSRAKAIICPAAAPYEPGELWDVEAEYIADLAADQIPEPSMALDFGCGVGRVARVLDDKHRWHLQGCDQSAGMRRLAAEYFSDFTVLTPRQLAGRSPASFDAGIAIWTLTCCFPLDLSIDLLRRSLQPGAKLFVAEPVERLVPKRGGGFFDDGADVFKALSRAFKCVSREWFMPPFLPPEKTLWWAIFEGAP